MLGTLQVHQVLTLDRSDRNPSVYGSSDWPILVDFLIFIYHIESFSTFEPLNWTVWVICLIFLNRFENFCLFRKRYNWFGLFDNLDLLKSSYWFVFWTNFQIQKPGQYLVNQFDCQRTYPNVIKVYQNKPICTKNWYYPKSYADNSWNIQYL